MSYRDSDEDDEADLDEREEPDESDTDAGDDAEVVPCPYCGKGVHEEAEVCPHCRNFIVAEDASRRRPWWVVAGAAACVVVVLLWILKYV